MAKVLQGRRALVTGASRGIGRAIALEFAAQGAAVAVTARNAAALDEMAAEIGALGVPAAAVAGDLGEEADITRIAGEAVDRLGGLDILVNNAALIPPFVDLVDVDPALWRRVLEVNLLAPALLMRAVLPAMIRSCRGGIGKIINIASIGARRGGRGRSAYRAAKAGLVNLTESVAAEVKEHGIDVVCICPGGVETEGVRAAFGEERLAQAKMMAPGEIAALAVFLASPAGSSITGTAVDAFGWTNPVFKDL